MPGIHCLQYIQRLRASALPNDNALGAHAKRRPDQIADRDRRNAFCIGIARLKPHQIRLVQKL